MYSGQLTEEARREKLQVPVQDEVQPQLVNEVERQLRVERREQEPVVLEHCVSLRQRGAQLEGLRFAQTVQQPKYLPEHAQRVALAGHQFAAQLGQAVLVEEGHVVRQGLVWRDEGLREVGVPAHGRAREVLADQVVSAEPGVHLRAEGDRVGKRGHVRVAEDDLVEQQRQTGVVVRAAGVSVRALEEEVVREGLEDGENELLLPDLELEVQEKRENVRLVTEAGHFLYFLEQRQTVRENLLEAPPK